METFASPNTNHHSPKSSSSSNLLPAAKYLSHTMDVLFVEVKANLPVLITSHWCIPIGSIQDEDTDKNANLLSERHMSDATLITAGRQALDRSRA
eukprot:jgi/Psemu1/18210/gm1.18210_g